MTARAGVLTAVVPNHNGAGFIGECLAALRRQTVPVDLVVVDDGSTDGSVAMLRRDHPDVLLVERPAAGGFGTAVNAGVRAAATPMVAVINSDARLDPDWAERVLALAAAHPDGWAWGGATLAPGRDLVDSAGDCYRPDGTAFRGLHGQPRERLATASYEVFAVPGAAVALDRERFAELGGYDERFGMYLEDIDLACRAHRRGWRCWVDPLAVAEHDGVRSSRPVRAAYLAGRNSVWCWLRYSPRLDAAEFARATRRAYHRMAEAGDGRERGYLRGRLAGAAQPAGSLRERRAASRAEPDWRRRIEAAMRLEPPERG